VIGVVEECGSGTWGSIPEESADATVWYVWGGYEGESSSGSQETPYKTISEALNKADDGDVIAVGSGDDGEEYPESVTVWTGVTLRGRCPSLVTISGLTETAINGMTAALYLYKAEGATIADLTVSSPGTGVVVDRGKGLRLENVASVGNLGNGIVVGAAEDVELVGVVSSYNEAGSGADFGIGLLMQNASQVLVSGAMLDGNVANGIYMDSSTGTIEDTMVRDTQVLVDGSMGWGMQVKYGSEVSLARCLVSGNQQVGIHVLSSELQMVDSVVIGTILSGDPPRRWHSASRNNRRSW